MTDATRACAMEMECRFAHRWTAEVWEALKCNHRVTLKKMKPPLRLLQRPHNRKWTSVDPEVDGLLIAKSANVTKIKGKSAKDPSSATSL